jgi:hypothetical protein
MCGLKPVPFKTAAWSLLELLSSEYGVVGVHQPGAEVGFGQMPAVSMEEQAPSVAKAIPPTRSDYVRAEARTLQRRLLGRL